MIELRGATITYYTCAEALSRMGWPINGVSLPAPRPQRITQRVMVADIQEAVSAAFQIPLAAMTSSRRARQVARPRQAAMYLSRVLTGTSLPEIGRRFGGRDHTTVIHAIRQVEKRIGEDPEFEQRLALAIKAVAPWTAGAVWQ
jgi:hypothetical protein